MQTKIKLVWEKNRDDLKWVLWLLPGFGNDAQVKVEGHKVQSQLMTLLLEEPFNSEDAQQTTLLLLSLLNGSFETLAQFQIQFSEQLLVGLTNEECAYLTPRLVALWAEVWSGFATAVTDTIQQEKSQFIESVHHDMTHRTRQKRKSDRRFQKLVDASFNPIVIHENGRILQINTAVTRVFGYLPNMLEGEHIYKMIAPHEHERIKQFIETRYEGPYDSIITHCNGTAVDVEVMARHLLVSGKEVRLVILQEKQAGLPHIDSLEEATLSEKQQKILYLVATGIPYQQIANEIGLSLSTVKYHMGEIYKKINVNSRPAAVTWAWHNLKRDDDPFTIDD